MFLIDCWRLTWHSDAVKAENLEELWKVIKMKVKDASSLQKDAFGMVTWSRLPGICRRLSGCIHRNVLKVGLTHVMPASNGAVVAKTKQKLEKSVTYIASLIYPLPATAHTGTHRHRCAESVTSVLTDSDPSNRFFSLCYFSFFSLLHRSQVPWQPNMHLKLWKKFIRVWYATQVLRILDMAVRIG